MENAPQVPKKEQFPRPIVDLEDVKTPEDFLNAVDFNVLNDIFDQIISRSGVSIDARTPLSKDLVKIHFAAGPVSHHNLEMRGSTTIGSPDINLYWSTISNDPSMVTYFSALQSLIHEATHTRAGVSQFESPSNEMRFKGGFREAVFALDDQGKIGSLHEIVGAGLDEAVTEEIALEVLREYLRRTGKISALNNTSQIAEYNQVDTAYVVDRVLLDTITVEIGLYVGIGRDEVWKAVVRGYMSDFTGPELPMSFIDFYQLVRSEMLHSGSEQMLRALGSDTPLQSDNKTLLELHKVAEAETKKALHAFSPEYISNNLGLH